MVTTPVRPVLVPFAVFGLAWGAWGAVVPAVQLRAGVDDRGLGFALLAIALGALPAMRQAPALLARWPRSLLPTLSVALVGSFVLASLATSFRTLAGALLLVGVVSGAHDVAMNARASAFERHRFRPVLQLAHACFSAAVVVAGASVGIVRQAGVDAPVAVAIVAVAAASAALSGLRPGPGATAATPASGPRARATAAPVGTWRLLLVLGAAALLASLVENALQSWSAVHLERTLGAPPLAGGLAAGAFAAGAAAGRLTAHRAAAGRPLRHIVLAAATLAAVALLVAGTTRSAVVALVAIVTCGAAISTLLPALLAEAGARSGDVADVAIARTATAAYLGFLVGPPIVGTIAHLTSLRVAFVALAVIALAIAPIAGRRLTVAREPVPCGTCTDAPD